MPDDGPAAPFVLPWVSHWWSGGASCAHEETSRAQTDAFAASPQVMSVINGLQPTGPGGEWTPGFTELYILHDGAVLSGVSANSELLDSMWLNTDGYGPPHKADDDTAQTLRYARPPRLTKAQYVQHTYNITLLKQQLTETNANTMSWELWSSNEESYLYFVEFLEATKQFKVNGQQLSVWLTLIPPSETEIWKNYTGCVHNASELCPAALPFPYGNSDAGWFCCGKPAPGNGCTTHDCCSYPGSLEACQGADRCGSNSHNRPVCPRGYQPGVDAQGMPQGPRCAPFQAILT